MKYIENFLISIGFILLFYVLIAWFTFQVRNPICNESAFYTSFISVLKFEKLEQYQTK